MPGNRNSRGLTFLSSGDAEKRLPALLAFRLFRRKARKRPLLSPLAPIPNCDVQPARSIGEAKRVAALRQTSSTT